MGRGRAACFAVAGPGVVAEAERGAVRQLEAELVKGPAAHGWEDQRWTLGRIKTVIRRRFHLAYTMQGVIIPGRLVLGAGAPLR